MASTMQITSSRMVRLRCSFFRAASKEASLSRRLCGEDVVFVEAAPLGRGLLVALGFRHLGHSY